MFLQLISVLRKIIEGDESEQETGGEVVFEESAEEPNQEMEVTTDVQRWKYPFWRDMQDGPSLPRKLSERGKVPFEYNRYPSGYTNPQSNSEQTRMIPVGARILKSSKYLAHTARHSLGRCQECKDLQYTTSVISQYMVGDKCIDISVPDHKYFEELRDRMQPQSSVIPPVNISNREKLHSWVFTPVARGSCRNGNLNLRHTIVDTFKQPPAAVPFIHVLVVDEDEFEEYRQQWRSTHAIVKMPGGHSGARKLIQEMALCLDLDKIFVIDDNIPYVYTVSIDD